MKKNILLTCGMAAMLMSCNDFLDIKPKGVAVPTKATEYEQLLNYAQMTKALDCSQEYLTDNVWMPDKGYKGFEDLDQAERNIYTFQSEIYDVGEYDMIWLQSYSRILYCNTVANQIMDSEGEEDYKLRVRADALVLRAFDYLGLVNAYGKLYDKNTASTDPGIPLQVSEVIDDSPSVRASVQAVYDQVQKDLDEAVKHLPEKNIFPYRGSKALASGLQSRMYLYMGNYEKAGYWAKETLKLNNTLLDMTERSVVDPDKTVGRTDMPDDADDNPENINIRFTPASYGLAGQTYPSPELLSLYSEDDARFQLWFTKKVGSNVVDNYIYAPYYALNVSITVQEMMLVAAECDARAGNKDGAMKYYNDLREKRIHNYTRETAVDAEDALRKVLDERRRELAFNGLHRLIDLKRLNKDPRFRKTIVHTVKGVDYVLEPESPKYVLPIPPMVTSMNPDMVLNER